MAKKISITTKPMREVKAATAEQWVDSGKTEAGGMKRFTIDVPAELHRRIKLQCAAQGLKMADEIRALLEKHFPPKAVE